MTKRFILLLIVIGFGFSMLACTTQRSQRYPRYPNYPQQPYPQQPYPGGQGYPNYPGYPGYPGGSNNGIQQIQALADHLKDATAEVAEEAKEKQDSEYQGTTIERLEDLDQEAKAFHKNMDSYQDRSRNPGYGNPGYGDPRYGDPRYGDPRSGDPRYGSQGADPNNARQRFTEVLQKYYSARNTLRELPREDEVQKDFERVTGIMRNLTRFYGYRFEPDYDDRQPNIL